MGNFLSKEFAEQIVIDKVDKWAANVPDGLRREVANGVHYGGRRGCLLLALNAPSVQMSASYLQAALFAETYEVSPAPTVAEVAAVFIRRLEIAIPVTKYSEKTTLITHKARLQTALYALKREEQNQET